ncbi:hypothetical protein HAX54_029723 [Datura stramonium]|uniref:Uncharacterized protein n=1 Tax=Datura stramonium TaxID=4076 RepID=A0ABS8RLF2_DATST|nr:hypothetical protein [Datura stramonium]
MKKKAYNEEKNKLKQDVGGRGTTGKKTSNVGLDKVIVSYQSVPRFTNTPESHESLGMDPCPREESFAEHKAAKRRIIMVDFHDMPKPSNDPRAPKSCRDRRRF